LIGLSGRAPQAEDSRPSIRHFRLACGEPLLHVEQPLDAAPNRIKVIVKSTDFLKSVIVSADRISDTHEGDACEPVLGVGCTRLEDQASHDLFARWRAGDEQALKELLPLIYEELRNVARRHLRSQRADHTLQTTALIHEAYLRLAGSTNPGIQDHHHFVALASRMMRQVLVDHARSRLAGKRRGGLRVTLSEAENVTDGSEVDVLGVDAALQRLFEFDEQQARIVELRFFGGLSIPETAQALQISPATVKRDWTMARTWLNRELKAAEPP
jgi:RNA polymerase sigma factor (TIGR02999 family)